MKLNPPYLLKEVPFNDLEGKTLTKTEGNENHEIIFYTNNNERYILKTGNYKNTEITGNFNDLLSYPVIYSRLGGSNPDFNKLLMGNLRINTTTSSVFIKWYCDYEDVKKRMEVSQEWI